MSQASETPLPPGPAFEDYLKRGELRLQVCADCSKQVFYPRTICPSCGSSRLDWHRPSGRGTVYSTTTIRQRPDRGGNYNLSIIELEEGARMMSRVEGIDPGEVRIGMAVEAAIVTVENEPLVVFHATGKSGA
jgi:uncharacterized protein